MMLDEVGGTRLVAVDVHQLRAGHWSCSEQYLHRIGRRPTPGCEQCNIVECPAARCRVCSEEADTPRHVLLRCPALAGRRLRRLGTIYPEATEVRDDGVVAALAAGYRAQLSLRGYAPLRGRGEQQQQQQPTDLSTYRPTDRLNCWQSSPP